MKRIRVGDWVLYESHACTEYEAGLVLCMLPEHDRVVVQMGGLVFAVRREHVFVVGDRDKIRIAMLEVETMLKDKREAIKKIEERRAEVAREHTDEIRRMLKLAGRE